MNNARAIDTIRTIRAQIRCGAFTGQTSGKAPFCIQGNVVILRKRYAVDFLHYCSNNPKPCPLIYVSKAGQFHLNALGVDIDIRTDVSQYCVYRNGSLTSHEIDIRLLWRDDFVTFVLGCSFTFEEVLLRRGFEVRHISQKCNVPMFVTSIPTVAAGAFSGEMVVSMRPYKEKYIPSIFDICSQYPHAHGAPLYWGDPSAIGIDDIHSPDFGEAVYIETDEIPVFWACGVTPQIAIQSAQPDICITHAPGCMLITDIHAERVPVIANAMQNFSDCQ